MIRTAGLAFILLAAQAGAAEVGIASTFYDRHVACAPFRINPYKVMGIAHKTLPCGTTVEVTNVRNGRTASAVVVDLGPCTTVFCQTRLPARIRKRRFDLLPLVAKAVGSSGLALVRVTAR